MLRLAKGSRVHYGKTMTFYPPKMKFRAGVQAGIHNINIPL
jgi:hypothetical protein